MKTKVAIIGAGPAGLLLGHSLRAAGIDCVILERRAREHIEGRIRAGLLESGTITLVDELGLGERMHAEGIVDTGMHLADGERMFRLEFAKLTGKRMLFYGQTELTKDLNTAAVERGLRVIWNANNVMLHDIDGPSPSVTFSEGSEAYRIEADILVGCDDFHGPSRKAIPNSER